MIEETIEIIVTRKDVFYLQIKICIIIIFTNTLHIEHLASYSALCNLHIYSEHII